MIGSIITFEEICTKERALRKQKHLCHFKRKAYAYLKWCQGITTVSPSSPGQASKILFLTEVGTRLGVVGIGGNVSKMGIGQFIKWWENSILDLSYINSGQERGRVDNFVEPVLCLIINDVFYGRFFI